MPHIAITMYPGRDDTKKQSLAQAVRETVSKELGIDKSIVSVSVQDIEKDSWEKEMAKFPKEALFIPIGK